MGNCEHCHKDVDHVHATVASYSEAEVSLEGENTEWEYDPDTPHRVEDHVQVTCPECKKQIYSGPYSDAEEWILDFLKGQA